MEMDGEELDGRGAEEEEFVLALLWSWVVGEVGNELFFLATRGVMV